MRADVVVCGGGPSSAAVAAECARRGLSVIVVSEDPSDGPRDVQRLTGRVAGANHTRTTSTVILNDGRIADATVVLDACDPPALVVGGDPRQQAVGIGPGAGLSAAEAQASAPRVAAAIAAAIDRRATPASVAAAAWDAVVPPRWWPARLTHRRATTPGRGAAE